LLNDIRNLEIKLKTVEEILNESWQKT
jgi:hypothetical protein